MSAAPMPVPQAETARHATNASVPHLHPSLVINVALCACGCGAALTAVQQSRRNQYASRRCRSLALWQDADYRRKHQSALIDRWAARKAARVEDMRRQGAMARFVRIWADAKLGAAWDDLEQKVDLDALSRADQRRLQVWLARLMRAQYVRAYQNGWRVGARKGAMVLPPEIEDGDGGLA